MHKCFMFTTDLQPYRAGILLLKFRVMCLLRLFTTMNMTPVALRKKVQATMTVVLGAYFKTIEQNPLFIYFYSHQD